MKYNKKPEFTTHKNIIELESTRFFAIIYNNATYLKVKIDIHVFAKSGRVVISVRLKTIKKENAVQYFRTKMA